LDETKNAILKLRADYRIKGGAWSSAAAADWDEYRCQL